MQRIRDFVVRLSRLPWSVFSITARRGNGPGVPSSMQATVMQLRYWLPTIADVAHVAETERGTSWHFSITPRIPGACPVEITLHETGSLDFVIAGQAYEGRTLDLLDQLLPLIERITEGYVVQRRWISRVTGQLCGIETVVSLAEGRVWSDGRAAPGERVESHDHHFLPYRRI